MSAFITQYAVHILVASLGATTLHFYYTRGEREAQREKEVAALFKKTQEGLAREEKICNYYIDRLKIKSDEVDMAREAHLNEVLILEDVIKERDEKIQELELEVKEQDERITQIIANVNREDELARLNQTN